MPTEPQNHSERELTDESLRVERERADLALAEMLAAVDEAADIVIIRARERADALLAKSRAKIDLSAKGTSTIGQSAEVVQRERASEDQVVQN